MAEEIPNSGLISTAKTQERESRFKWVGPIASGTQCIYKLSSRTDIQIEDASSLTQYTLAAIRENAFNIILDSLGFTSEKNLIWFSMKYGDLKPFAAGRVDLIVGSALTIESQVQHAELALSDISPVFVIDLLPHYGNFLALNIDTNDAIVNSLQKSLERLRINKEFETIENKFVKPSPMTQTNATNQTLWNTCVKTTSRD
jgi:polar amino acid transport system substrate-binding protein